MRHIALIEAHDEVANELLRKLTQAVETTDGKTTLLAMNNNVHTPERLLAKHYNVALAFVSYDKHTNTKGLHTAEAIKRALPDTKVVLIGDDCVQYEVRRLRLDGWFLKQSFSPPQRLREFITTLGIKLEPKGTV